MIVITKRSSADDEFGTLFRFGDEIFRNEDKFDFVLSEELDEVGDGLERSCFVGEDWPSDDSGTSKWEVE